MCTRNGTHSLCSRSAASSYDKESDGWYYGEKLQSIDPESFHLLFAPGSDNPCFADYAADKRHVYMGASIFPAADPATFKVLGGRYSRDAARVYYYDKVLGGADAKTFTEISRGIFKDSKHVYADGAPVENTDPATFSFLGDTGGLAHDATHVFYDMSVIPGINPKDVKYLGRGYWGNNRTIFFEKNSLAPADPATFKVAGEDEIAFSAEDKDHYFLDNIVSDKSSCRKVGRAAVACKNYILASLHKYSSKIDPASLHYLGTAHLCRDIEGTMIYEDKHGIYEFFDGGPIMKFINFPPGKQSIALDKTLERRLCSHPATQSLEWDNP